jgi:hypothetical protein
MPDRVPRAKSGDGGPSYGGRPGGGASPVRKLLLSRHPPACSGNRQPRDTPLVIPLPTPHFPRLINPCLQSSHPVADTLQGVAARRARRRVWGKDAKSHAPGLRKVVSLRRHGGSDGISDRSCRFAPRTARRMCLCGIQGGWIWRMRRHRLPGWNAPGEPHALPSGRHGARPDVKTGGPFRKPAGTIVRPGLCRGTGVAGKNR